MTLSLRVLFNSKIRRTAVSFWDTTRQRRVTSAIFRGAPDGTNRLFVVISQSKNLVFRRIGNPRQRLNYQQFTRRLES
jgi:hypothetical protein